MTEPVQEQGIELIARQLAFQTLFGSDDRSYPTVEDAWRWVVKEDFIEEFYTKAWELLALRYPCRNPNCKDGAVTDSNPYNWDEKNYIHTCEKCKGTGFSNIPVLARVDPDQTPPKNKWDGVIDFHQNIRLATKQGYDEAQQDMIKGHKTSRWVKVLK